MSRKNIEIAPNYALNGSVAQTLNEAMDHRIFTYRSTGAQNAMPEVALTDEMTDRLGYLLYPQHIKGLTAAQHSAMDLVREGFDNLLEHQQIEPFYPKDTLGFIKLTQQIRSGDMQHALATVMDFETITMKDAFGNEKNWIYNAGFYHIHSDATIGKFKNNKFQHIFIGIYDEQEAKYLADIAEKVKNTGVRSLSQEQSVAFEFLSRFGASMRENGITQLTTAVPDNFLLTEASKDVFGTVDNFNLARKALKNLGDTQIKASRSGTVPEGVEQIIDNIVETFVNKNSMITGWNVPYDVNKAIEMVENVPGANEYFKSQIKSYGLNPDNYNIGDLRKRQYDPTNHLIYPSSGVAKQKWYKSFYGTDREARDIGTHAVAFDNMLIALQKQYPDEDIFKNTHHLGGTDVLQEMFAIFDKDSRLTIFEDEALKRGEAAVQQYNKNFAIEGLLLQAQDSGSMQSLMQYNKNVFATVESSNGDLYTSTGLKYDSAKQKWIHSSEFTPGAWKEGMTYEIIGADIFEKDSKMAQAIVTGRPEMMGSDLVRLQMRVGLLNDTQRMSEMGQEIRSIYMPVEMVPRELGTHFRVIGEKDQNGNIALNSFGRQQAEVINKKYNGVRYDYSKLKPEDAYRDMNEMGFLDRAERSFTKRSLQTNSNAILLHDLYETGSYESFSAHGSRAVQLQKAVREAGQKGNTKALERILTGSSVNKSAAEIAGLFNIDDVFNAAWFSNTFTIAQTMKKGSLFEQMHKEALQILGQKEYQNLFSAHSYYKGQMYRAIMDEGTRALMATISPEKLKQMPGWVGKPTNDAYAYWLKADDFLRGYRDTREVLSEAEAVRKSWLKLDLSSPVKVVSSIKSATGLKGAAAENDRNVKRNMIDFLEYLKSDKSRIDQIARDEITTILDNSVSSKSIYGLGADISAVFQGLKKRQHKWGWAPEEIMLEHNSFMTVLAQEDNIFQKPGAELITSAMKRAAQQQSDMFVNYKYQADFIETKLRKFMIGEEFKNGEFAQMISHYDDAAKNATLELYEQHKNAVNNYAHGLIESLQYTGVGISVGERSVRVNYGGKTIDISDLIPKLRANSGGAMSWMLGENNTRYVAAAGIGLGQNATQLKLVSMLDHYQRSMFAVDNYGRTKLQRLLQNSIATGDDPLSMFKWGLKLPAGMIGENSLIKGSPSFDVRNMLYANLAPILDNKKEVGRLLNAARSRNLSEAQQNAIRTLTEYYESWGRKQPMISLEQQNAILTLISDDNPLLSPNLKKNIRLNASAKQTGSDATRIAIAQVGSVSENIDDPGKYLSHQLDNSLYFKTQRTAQEARILESGGITDLAFGPRFATKMEQSIANVAENGIDLSNRVVLNALEANDAIKTQIYDMLVQKYQNDKTIAAVFGSRFMPHEGGGLISSRIMDVLQNPLGYQKVTWKPSIYTDMKSQADVENFLKKAELQFTELQDGYYDFAGYGRGMLIKKDDPVWSFYSRYFNEVRPTEAKRDSVLNVLYMTKNGGQIVDEDTLKKEVTAKLKEQGLSRWTREQWIEAADSLYDRKIVAQNLFDSGAVKIGVDSEKHESQTMARAISQFWNGDNALQDWQKEEKLLHDIFYSDEFNKIGSRLSVDFRTGRTLSAQWYYDIANMNMDSPLFGSVKEAEAVKKMIRQKVGAFIGSDNEDDINRTFYRMMDQARHRLSDDIKKLVGTEFLGKSMDQMAGHGNVDMLLFATTTWLEQQMQKNQTAITTTNELRKRDFAEAVRMINETGAITDRSGRAISLTIDPVTGGAIIETDRPQINPNKLKNALKNFGLQGQDLDNEWSRILSDMRDTPAPGIFFTHRAEARFTIDYSDLDKLYKMSDRELVSYTNTLFDDEIIERLKSQMDEKTFKSLLGKYVDDNNKLKAEFRHKSMWGDALDSHFRDAAFMTPLNRISKDDNKKYKLLGDILYDENKKYGNDLYRADKTRDLVRRLAPEGADKNFATRISQQYADNLYEYASLQQAARFNSGEINASQLISDAGNIKTADLQTKQFFKEAKIGDIDTFATISKKHLMDPEYSMFKRNFLVDVTDDALGLDEFTLGRGKIALAGIDLQGEGQAEFQAKFKRLQDKYAEIKKVGKSSPEHANLVAEYRGLVNDVVDLQKEYASGDKVKSSISAKLMKSNIAGSLNNKVNVFQTEHTDSSLRDFLSQRTYKGENLADLYDKGRKVNFAVVSEADLVNMGFNDEYFKAHGIDKAKWLEKVEKEGIGGRAHRWPTDYWGSTTSVQIYLDRTRNADTTAYDAITAAFLKADSDGDTAQLILNSTRNEKGQFIDELSAAMNSKMVDESTKERLKVLQQNHDLQMQVQILDTNKMIKHKTDYHKAYDNLYQQYKQKILAGTEDSVLAITKKNSRMDLAGNIISFEPLFLKESEKTQYRNAFNQHRERIASAIEQIGGDTDVAKQLRSKSNAEEAANALREYISKDFSARDKIYSALGNDADTINLAFRNAASMTDARTIALQRIARKGAGLADTPFTSMDFLRMNALALDKVSINNSQNIAMDMVKELTKEQLLTPKKMDVANIYNITSGLDRLTTMLDDIMKNGKGNSKLKEDFIDFIAGNEAKGIKGIARDPNSRYQVGSLLSAFATEANGEKMLDMRKITAEAYDGFVNAAESLRENTTIFNLLRANMVDTSRGFKGRIGALQALSKTQAGAVNRAVATSNGIEEAIQRAGQVLSDEEERIRLGASRVMRNANKGKDIIEKTVKDFRPSKKLALSALTLAGAAVFGGYTGGNPARPAQQQAQEIYEQNPTPRNINMADPSLTASNRKQAGYVININAQTQRDKEYASRLITQAVTRNFQDTNINVSMNVNQQPGNISGNDLMDYLEQALY